VKFAIWFSWGETIKQYWSNKVNGNWNKSNGNFIIFLLLLWVILGSISVAQKSLWKKEITNSIRNGPMHLILHKLKDIKIFF
jgi:hypothetical protein